MFRRIIKWVLWVTGLLWAILVLTAAGLFFAPTMVSTDWFRHQVETKASKAFHRQIIVKDLQWSWQEGIRIRGLEASDDPKYGKGPILSVGQLLFSFDFEPTRKRLSMDLEVDGLKAHLIREKDGRTNLGAWLAQMKTPRKTGAPVQEKKNPATAFTPPGDLAVDIKLKNVQCRMDDRMENRSLLIRDGAFSLRMPSLLSKPVTLSFNSRQQLDADILPPLELTVHVDHLVDETRTLNPQAALFDIKGHLPGLKVALEGSMAQKGLQGSLKIDFDPLTTTVKPFMPAAFPELSGRILLQTKARLKTKNTVIFDLTLACEDVRVSGGPLKEKRIGPITFTLVQKGRVDPENKEITLEGGKIRFMEKCGASFGGRVKLREKGGARVNLTLSRVRLGLNDMKKLAKGFIPESIRVNGSNNAERPDFEIKEIQLNGLLPEGELRLSLKDLSFNLATLDLSLSERRLNAEDLAIKIPHTTLQLKHLFPRALEMRADLGVGKVHLTGKQPVQLAACRIASLNLAVRDLRRSPDALWGMAGRITVEETGLARGIRLQPRNDGTSRLAHGFKADILLPGEPKARIISAEVNLSTAPLKMAAFLRHSLKDGLTINGHVKDALITGLTPLMLDVGALDAHIRSGDFLDLHLKGSASDSGMKRFQTRGSLGVDIAQALSLAPDDARPEGRFTGRLETVWRLQGRRPTPEEQASLFNNTLSLEKRLGHTDFLEKLEIETRLLNMGVTLPLASGETLSIRKIHSPSPLKISASNGLKSISFEGNINIDTIGDLPFPGKPKPPLSVGISFKGTGRDLNSLELRESLHVAPLAVEQTLELSLNKLNRILRNKNKPNLESLLKTLEARINVGVSVNPGSGPDRFSRDISLKSPLRGRLELQLNSGKTISARTFLETEGLSAALPSKFDINNLKTHLQLDKTYGLTFGPPQPRSRKSRKALSLMVLKPEKAPGPPPGFKDPLSRRLVDDLRGRLSGKPTLSFDSARLEGGPFPIRINKAQWQIRLNESLPSVDYFQMGMLGGILLGELGIIKDHGRFLLQMDVAFSGLDTDRLLQRKGVGRFPTQGEGGEETQVSGKMSLRIPVSPHAGTVMNDLNAVFRLSRIGARTLERLLYAMDPHENNERIVQQRALLKKGTPRWIEVVIRHGSLSLTGEVAVGGSNIDLPPIKRLNMTGLPIQTRIQNLAERLAPLVKALKILSADTLRVDGDAMEFTEKSP